MKIDLTLKLAPPKVRDAEGNPVISFSGHYGTHFDVMNKEFPLDYTEREGIVFDVAKIRGRDIEAADIDMDQVHENMFVAFCSDFVEEEGYGTPKYTHEHPALSVELIEALLKKGISIIGLDFAGVRRGEEHTPMDQYCADNGVFVVENLCNLRKVMEISEHFSARTYPINFTEMTGLPCRVIAEL